MTKQTNSSNKVKIDHRFLPAGAGKWLSFFQRWVVASNLLMLKSQDGLGFPWS